MKNRLFILLFSLIAVITLGFVFAGETYAKTNHADCVNCLEHKQDCCKDCSKDCTDCKNCCDNCKQCCEKKVDSEDCCMDKK